jgi:hypothetical protein
VEDVEPTITLATLTDLVEAVAGRLRSLGDARLGRPPMRVGLGIAEPVRADGPSVAERAYELSQYLSALGARIEGREVPPLPRLADMSAGDQVAVVGHDLVEALRAAARREYADDEARLGEDERELAERLLRDAVSAVKDLRREL